MTTADGKTHRVAVAQIGARMHYAVPTILHRAGMLEALYTDICAETGWVPAMGRCVPRSLLPRAANRLLARRINDVPRARIVSFNGFGISRILNRSRARTPARMFHHLMDANSSFGQRIAAAGLGQSDVVYTFNGASLEILQYARARGIRTFLEQTSAPIGFDERLLAEERERWPGWEFTGATPADWQPMADREKQEWNLADTIVCGSQYVVDAIRAEGGPVHKCKVVPYGVEAAQFPVPQRSRKPRLRVLCIATVQLRKGVQYLIETAKLLKNQPVELHLVGPLQVSPEAISQLRQALTVVGEVPRSRIAEEYENADVFVLPSISEGSATVCYEALAMGLPVITTPNAGSVIRDGLDGFIVPIRDPRALADRIATLAGDRDLLDEMSHNARLSAQNYTWDCYGQRLIDAIQQPFANAA